MDNIKKTITQVQKLDSLLYQVSIPSVTANVLFTMHVIMISMLLVGLYSSDNIRRDLINAGVGTALLITSVVILDGLLLTLLPNTMSVLAIGTCIFAVSSIVGTMWRISQHYLHT